MDDMLDYYLNSLFLEISEDDINIIFDDNVAFLNGRNLVELIDDPGYYLLWILFTDESLDKIGFWDTTLGISVSSYSKGVNVPHKENVYDAREVFNRIIELGYLELDDIDYIEEGLLKAALQRRMNRRNKARLKLKHIYDPADYKKRSQAAKLGWRRNRGRYKLANSIKSKSMRFKRNTRIGSLLNKMKV